MRFAAVVIFVLLAATMAGGWDARADAFAAPTVAAINPRPPHSSSEAPETQPLTPTQFRTRQRIYTALRIGGVLTTIGLVTLIALLLYREHRKTAPAKQEQPT